MRHVLWYERCRYSTSRFLLALDGWLEPLFVVSERAKDTVAIECFSQARVPRTADKNSHRTFQSASGQPP